MKAYLNRDEISFSIIIPVYNSANDIEKCLETVVNQSFKNYELIIIDRGSTDNTINICKKYKAEYNFIKLLKANCSDCSQAKNMGIEESKNDWLFFMEDSGRMDKNMLLEIAKCIYRSHADLYHFNTQISDSRNNIIYKRIFTIENDIFRFEKELWWFKYYFHEITQHHGGCEAWTRIFKRKTIEENNLRFYCENEVYDSDLLFIFNYTLCIKNLYVICNILYSDVREREKADLYIESGEYEVLKELNYLLKIAYKKVKECAIFYFKDNYEKLYFMILNYYIKNQMLNIPQEKIYSALEDLKKDSFHRKNMKKALKSASELEEYEGEIKWLKRKKS